jgi:hypothetical protein
MRVPLPQVRGGQAVHQHDRLLCHHHLWEGHAVRIQHKRVRNRVPAAAMHGEWRHCAADLLESGGRLGAISASGEPRSTSKYLYALLDLACWRAHMCEGVKSPFSTSPFALLGHLRQQALRCMGVRVLGTQGCTHAPQRLHKQRLRLSQLALSMQQNSKVGHAGKCVWVLGTKGGALDLQCLLQQWLCLSQLALILQQLSQVVYAGK